MNLYTYIFVFSYLKLLFLRKFSCTLCKVIYYYYFLNAGNNFFNFPISLVFFLGDFISKIGINPTHGGDFNILFGELFF